MVRMLKDILGIEVSFYMQMKADYLKHYLYGSINYDLGS